VLAVNGWMNDPGGFRLVDGRAVDIEPLRALFGGHVRHELVQMLLAAYMAAGFSVAGVYAWGWPRGGGTATTASGWWCHSRSPARPGGAVGLGARVLVPSLACLFRLVLAGRLDKDPPPEGAPEYLGRDDDAD